MTGRQVVRTVIGLAAALALSGCGGGSEADAAQGAAEPESGAAAADTSVCVADASPAPSPYAGDFPADWPFPDGAVVHGAEDRGDSGTVVTAVVASDFHEVLDFMNEDVVRAGFVVESGETEDDDAEAEWSGNGYRGRWAIRESTACSGETVIQVLAAPGEQ
jgi:hypothetical protein